MKFDRTRKIYRAVTGLLAVVLVFISFSFGEKTVYAEEHNHEKSMRKVRVGFPIQKGLTEKDEDGNYIGYTVDYLNQLSKYTEWDIEYVEAEGTINEQLTTLMQMLEDGEIDMLGAMNYSPALEEMYLYPTYYYGTAYTIIAVMADSDRWMEDDYQNWNGMRVAAVPTMKKRLELLEKYAEVCGFTYEVVEYDSYSKMLKAVQTGECDALLQIDIAVMSNDLRSIGKFSPNPYYFALNLEQTELLREVNAGMGRLLEAYPSLQVELYNKYFATDGVFYLSEENKKWIESLGTLDVLFFNGNMPIQSTVGGTECGVAKNFFDKLSEETGLQYNVVTANSFEEGLKLIQENKVDLVAAVPGDTTLNTKADLHLTLPYFESNGVYVSEKTNWQMVGEETQKLSANVQKKMKEINQSSDQSAILDAYCVNYYMHKEELYRNLSIDWSTSIPILYSVGFTGNVDEKLITIINSFTKSITAEEKQQMLYNNINIHPKYTFLEQVYVYRWRIAIGVICMVLVSMLYVFYRKSKALQKGKAESERLYQFSRMTDECLFEYDFKTDKLILQNNRFIFPNKHVVYQFMKKIPHYVFDTENERKCVNILQGMLQNRESKLEFAVNIDGVEVWYKATIVYIDGTYAVGRVADANQDVKERKELEYKAKTDQLTGLLNRAALNTIIEEHIQSGCEDGVYMLLDLDNFKNVNDTYGHREGDVLLCKFANTLESYFKGTDLIARLGGDEFVIFMPNKMEEKDLRENLAEFIRYIKEEVFSKYSQCNVSVSVGVAFICERAHSAEGLYKEADGAMYVAKYGGKNDFFISDGIVCMRRTCVECRPDCRQKEYLQKKGVLQTADKNAIG